MPIRQVLYYPDTKLRQVAAPVEKIDPAIENLIHDMFATMYQYQGGGLAATQLGIPLQVAIIDDGEHEPFVLINPKIVTLSNEKIKNVEGCLSVPGVSAEIERPNCVKVAAQDKEGKLIEIEARDNYLARCLQHEIDHLYGKLYIDYLSPLKRERLLRDMRKKIKESD